jgi:hypothetical protein
MKTTRVTVAKKLTAYLQDRLPLTGLVDWAERAMMEADFEAQDAELLADIVGRLGLADVAEFGLRWEDAEDFLHRLGYRVQVEVQAA